MRGPCSKCVVRGCCPATLLPRSTGARTVFWGSVAAEAWAPRVVSSLSLRSLGLPRLPSGTLRVSLCLPHVRSQSPYGNNLRVDTKAPEDYA